MQVVNKKNVCDSNISVSDNRKLYVVSNVQVIQ